jgi:hypothetical protein
MFRIAFTAACLSFVALTGCATVQVQRDKAAQVKTVAIIGFTGVTQLEDKNAPKNPVGNIMNAVNDSKDVFGGELDHRRIQQAESVYTMLEKQLEQSVGWKVADRKALSADSDYKAWLVENPNVDTVRAMGLQRLPDVLRAEVAEQMRPKDRADLCQRLNVDAVVIAKLKYVIGDKGGFALGGFGKTTIYPKAIVEFTVLDGGDKPVWRDRYAEGKPTQDGLENIMGAKNNDNESQVLTAAADSALGKLIERYKATP